MRQAQQWEVIGSYDCVTSLPGEVRALVEAAGVGFVENAWDTIPGPEDQAIVMLDDGTPFVVNAAASEHHSYLNVHGRIHSAPPAELARRFAADLGLPPPDAADVLPDWESLYGPAAEFRDYPPGRNTAEVRAKRRMLNALEQRLGRVLQPELVVLGDGGRVPVDGTDADRTVLVRCLSGLGGYPAEDDYPFPGRVVPRPELTDSDDPRIVVCVDGTVPDLVARLPGLVRPGGPRIVLCVPVPGAPGVPGVEILVVP